MRTILILFVATGMSIVGTLLLESVGFPKMETAGTWGRERHYAYVALISCTVWLAAYHLWIKHGTRLRDKMMLAIGVPFVGTFFVGFIWGIIVFFWFWWVFIPISFVTVSLLALIARQRPEKGSAP